MKAKELMIGDWVKVKCFDKSMIEVKVSAIEESRIVGDMGNGSSHWGNLKDIYPIPLTDKILEKNGFDYHHKNFAALSYEHSFQLEMVEWPNEDGIGLWMVGGLLKIRYVHELQHALRLCDIDKVIIIDEG